MIALLDTVLAVVCMFIILTSVIMVIALPFLFYKAFKWLREWEKEVKEDARGL